MFRARASYFQTSGPHIYGVIQGHVNGGTPVTRGQHPILKLLGFANLLLWCFFGDGKI